MGRDLHGFSWILSKFVHICTKWVRFLLEKSTQPFLFYSNLFLGTNLKLICFSFFSFLMEKPTSNLFSWCKHRDHRSVTKRKPSPSDRTKAHRWHAASGGAEGLPLPSSCDKFWWQVEVTKITIWSFFYKFFTVLQGEIDSCPMFYKFFFDRFWQYETTLQDSSVTINLLSKR